MRPGLRLIERERAMKALQTMVGAMLAAGTVVLVGAGSAGAAATAAPAVKGVGSIQCSVSGKVKFNPALSSSSTPTTVKVNLTLSGCHGSNAGKTVSGGEVEGTLTGTPAGDCGVTQFSTSGALTVTYTVKSGHPKLTPTTLMFNTVQAVDDSTVEGQVNGAVTGGSFGGDGSFTDLMLTQSSPCSAKWTPGAGSTFELG
jgi:hypothetical protein